MLNQRMCVWVSAIGLMFVCAEFVSAQDRGDFGRGERGGRSERSFGDRGERGGFGGGPPSGFGERGSFGGGPPSGFGERGGFGGGAPSGFGERGGFGGGPPSGFGERGGFGGGPPGSFGDRGGSRWGGGAPGGMSPWGGGAPGGMSPWGGGAPGGGGEDRSSRFGSMMDRNGNGVIDQEEIDQMPSFFRDMMQSRGVQLRAGMSVDDMRNTMRSGFAGGSGDARTNPWDPNSRNGDDRRRNSGPQPYRQKQQQRITVDLPPKYSELDLDFDGQLAYHEWLVSRRDDIDQFDMIDVDGDGFLTPTELLDYDSGALDRMADSLFAGIQASKLVIVGAPPSGNRGIRDSRDSRGSESGDNRSGRERGFSGNSEVDATAQRYFQAMDRNRNGMIDMDEWERSQRLRPMFEQGGVRIAEMREDEFIRNYARVAGNSR